MTSHTSLTSDDGRIVVTCTRHAYRRHSCDIYIDNRFVAHTDGHSSDFLEHIASQTLEWWQAHQVIGPQPPMVMVESDGQQVPWVEMARHARLRARMSLVECRNAIEDRLDERISMSELSAWERGAVGLPEVRIVKAWADVLGISGPVSSAVTS